MKNIKNNSKDSNLSNGLKIKRMILLYMNILYFLFLIMEFINSENIAQNIYSYIIKEN